MTSETEPVTDASLFLFPAGDTDVIVKHNGQNVVGRVSSTALAAASPVWRKLLLSDPDKSGENPCCVCNKVAPYLDFSEEDGDTLLVLWRIAHFDSVEVPLRLEACELFRMAILVDKFGLFILVNPWAKDWLWFNIKTSDRLLLTKCHPGGRTRREGFDHLHASRIWHVEGAEYLGLIAPIYIKWDFRCKEYFRLLAARLVLSSCLCEPKSIATSIFGETQIKESTYLPEGFMEFILEQRQIRLRMLLELVRETIQSDISDPENKCVLAFHKAIEHCSEETNISSMLEQCPLEPNFECSVHLLADQFLDKLRGFICGKTHYMKVYVDRERWCHRCGRCDKCEECTVCDKLWDDFVARVDSIIDLRTIPMSFLDKYSEQFGT
ncbi:hypothetical protein HYFRA_00004573 [Hymenoscyphus fraxineus]|uniref:BTB domain-containing protein n=1 Tax=Hymenoscyphus fraxineus TaxID=746836 RepID=A0A9N9PUM3_9HELO|nr:hypothetical protein HYFRA_00004573 [Hymenoscyphus fraxineus]